VCSEDTGILKVQKEFLLDCQSNYLSNQFKDDILKVFGKEK